MKRRASSPLREFPVRKTVEENDESSDYVMEEIKDEQSVRSHLQEKDDINMEQADYERDSETEEEEVYPQGTTEVKRLCPSSLHFRH